jgi:diguanylate cyclase (GGDEF)-like protein
MTRQCIRPIRAHRTLPRLLKLSGRKADRDRRRMRFLRPSLDRPLHHDGDPYDDGPLPDLTSGLMWLATGIVGLAVQPLPGTDHSHMGWVVALAGFAIVWGLISLHLALRGKVMPLGQRALVTAAMMPVVAVALWATGGAESYLQPVLLFAVLFVAWFFPPPTAAVLVFLLVLVHASPFLYDGDALELGYLARTAIFAVIVAGMTLTMQFLKRVLVRAEMQQRRHAECDALTGVANRRGFDLALAATHEREERYALILFDFDDFKQINDEHGHPVGDAVLIAVAHAARDVVRHGDCLARIGGDEFALIAPGAGERAVLRLMRAVGEAIHAIHLPGVGSVQVTFAWASAPDHATDPDGLVRAADARLMARKRERRQREAVAAAI